MTRDPLAITAAIGLLVLTGWLLLGTAVETAVAVLAPLSPLVSWLLP